MTGITNITRLPTERTPDQRSERRRKARERAQRKRDAEEKSQAAVWRRMSSAIIFDFECENDNLPAAQRAAGRWRQP